ncbi:hypothetical protein Tco_0346099, partial [Tanacetum coccineum]
PTNAHAEENNVDQAEFTNPFCTPVQEIAEFRWTKDHPLTQVRGNPSKPVQTRRQLATDPEIIEYQLADMFTKALSEDRFQYLVRRIGMRCLTPA